MNIALQYKDTLVHDRTEVCCPEFEISEWDYAQHDWNKKLFLQDSVPGLFYKPFPGPFRKAVARMQKISKEAKAIPNNGKALVLTQSSSPFKSVLFMAVSKEVPGLKTTRLSGAFISRVFDGSNTAQSIRGLNGYLTSLGKMAKKYYFYHPYCSHCAKKHGHNYIVAIAETKTVDPYY